MKNDEEKKIQRERNNRSIECLDFFTVGHHDVLGIEEYRILFKNIVSGWIGCCQCHFLDHHSENSSGRWARKIVIRMTRSIQKCAFEQYSSCLDRLCPRTTICSKTKSSRREIFSFWQKNIFFLPQFFLDALDHQSELEIDPTSLYIGKSTWNERFKNVYDGFGILNRCEDPELAEKLGNFLTLSVTNIILTRGV